MNKMEISKAVLDSCEAPMSESLEDIYNTMGQGGFSLCEREVTLAIRSLESLGYVVLEAIDEPEFQYEITFGPNAHD